MQEAARDTIYVLLWGDLVETIRGLASVRRIHEANRRARLILLTTPDYEGLLKHCPWFGAIETDALAEGPAGRLMVKRVKIAKPVAIFDLVGNDTSRRIKGGFRFSRTKWIEAAAKPEPETHPVEADGPGVERQPVGLRIVDWALFTMQNHFVVDAGIGLLPIPVPPEMHRGVFEIFFSDTPMGATRRARFEEAVKTQRTEFQAHDLEIGYSYPAGALVPDGSQPPPTDPMGSIYYPTTRPGHRLPHAWLNSAGGRISTHDLTGNDGRFVLITGPEGPWGQAAVKAAEKFGIDIAVASIGKDYEDVDGQWESVRQIEPDGAILVRPDNYVAWRSKSASKDATEALATAVGTVLHR